MSTLRARAGAVVLLLGSGCIAGCGNGPAAHTAGAAQRPARAGDSNEARKPGATLAPRASSAGVDRAFEAPPPALPRRELLRVLSPGLGAFLQRVQVAPVFKAGQFHGWRIVSLSPGMHLGELAPGDVVTMVNGRAIERPEQALETWQSVALAPELRVVYERAGVPHEMAYSIVDDPR